MAFYYIIFLCLTVGVFLESIHLDRRVTNAIYWVFCLFFCFLASIRWETGTDWINYYNYFQNVDNLEYGQDSFEVGFGMLNRVVRSISDNYTLLLTCSAMLLFFFQSIAIKKLSPYPLISLIFLWSLQFANILFVRQWISVSILAFSVIFIEKRKPILFILFVSIAASFHRTSLIFILAWWIYHLKISIRQMIVILIFAVCSSVALTKAIEFLAGGLGPIVQAKIEHYLSSEYNQELKEDFDLVSLMIRGFANKILILITCFFFYGKIIKRYPKFKGYFNLYWFGAVIYFFTLPISIVLVRMSYSFDFFQLILVPYIFTEFKTTPARSAFIFIYFIYLALRLNQILNGVYQDEFIPFKTVFN